MYQRLNSSNMLQWKRGAYSAVSAAQEMARRSGFGSGLVSQMQPLISCGSSCNAYQNLNTLYQRRHFASIISSAEINDVINSARSGSSRMETKKSLMSLERIVSNRGLASRKEASRLILSGKVQVDGKTIKSPKLRFVTDIEVVVDGTLTMENPVLAIYNKPYGVHCSVGDPRNRQNLERVMRDFPFLKILHPVGRLDSDSSGLLLFSKQGNLTNFLLHPSFHVPKEYVAIVTGKVDHEKLKQSLEDGIAISIGTFKMKLIESRLVNEQDVTHLHWFSEAVKGFNETQSRFNKETIELGLGSGGRVVDDSSNNGDGNDDDGDDDDGEEVHEIDEEKVSKRSNSKDNQPIVANVVGDVGSDVVKAYMENLFNKKAVSAGKPPQEALDDGLVKMSLLRVEVTEGKNRMVRRILHNAGHSVVALHRIRIGEIQLCKINDSINSHADSKSSSNNNNNSSSSISDKMKRSNASLSKTAGSSSSGGGGIHLWDTITPGHARPCTAAEMAYINSLIQSGTKQQKDRHKRKLDQQKKSAIDGEKNKTEQLGVLGEIVNSDMKGEAKVKKVTNVDKVNKEDAPDVVKVDGHSVYFDGAEMHENDVKSSLFLRSEERSGPDGSNSKSGNRSDSKKKSNSKLKSKSATDSKKNKKPSNGGAFTSKRQDGRGNSNSNSNSSSSKNNYRSSGSSKTRSNTWGNFSDSESSSDRKSRPFRSSSR